MDAIVALASKAFGIVLDAISNREADVEASRVAFVNAAHELYNGLRDLRASEKADHDAAIAEHLKAGA